MTVELTHLDYLDDLRKHRVSFEEAATALKDPMAATGCAIQTIPWERRDSLPLVSLKEVGCWWWLTLKKTRLFESLAHVWQATERERYMKNTNRTDKDELRAEYKPSDFPEGFVRGKYADRLGKSSNIIVLKPEVAEVFPNEEAVDNALLSLIELARKTTRPTKRSTGCAKTPRAG
jgi:hypothetical protein